MMQSSCEQSHQADAAKKVMYACYRGLLLRSLDKEQDSSDEAAASSTTGTPGQSPAESEASTAPPSPTSDGVASCGIVGLPLQEGLACFLTPGGLGCLSLCCNMLHSELTLEIGGDGDTERRRVLLMPVIDVHIEDAEEMLARISLPHVRTLRIWGRLSFNAVIDAVRHSQGLCALERFALKGCGLYPQDVKEMLEPALAATKRIKLLSLEKNRITCDTLKALAASEVLSRVESLNVRFNNIGNDGVKALVKSPWAKSLQVLNLKQNRVTDDGAVALASMLRGNQSMRLLNLRRQTPPLTDTAAKAFAESLRENSSALQQLRLRRNRLTDVGAVALAAAAGDRMARLCKEFSPWDLRLELDLEENRIGDKGALALLAMAAKCQRPVRLELLLASNPASRDSLCSAVVDAGQHLDPMDSRVQFESKAEGGL